MKIICDSQEEYDKLMVASRYLHDFSINETELEFEENAELDLNIEMVNMLSHLHVSKNLVFIHKPLTSEQVDTILSTGVELGHVPTTKL
jgi:hypothetical protein